MQPAQHLSCGWDFWPVPYVHIAQVRSGTCFASLDLFLGIFLISATWQLLWRYACAICRALDFAHITMHESKFIGGRVWNRDGMRGRSIYSVFLCAHTIYMKINTHESMQCPCKIMVVVNFSFFARRTTWGRSWVRDHVNGNTLNFDGCGIS